MAEFKRSGLFDGGSSEGEPDIPLLGVGQGNSGGDNSEGGGNGMLRLPYALAKERGIATEGLTPSQVWQKLKGQGVDPEKEKEKFEQEQGEKAKSTAVKIKANREKLIHMFANVNETIVRDIAKIKESNKDNWKQEEYEGLQAERGKAFFRPAGYLSKPQVVSRQDYDAMVEDGAKVFYRGVPIKEYDKQLRDGEDVFIGQKWYGNGLYASPNPKVSEHYAGGEAVAEFILSPSANVYKPNDYVTASGFGAMSATSESVLKLVKDKMGSQGLSKNEFAKGANHNPKLMETLAFIASGYDAVQIDDEITLVLNRGALIMKGDK